jgi:hypothetical protein
MGRLRPLSSALEADLRDSQRQSRPSECVLRVGSGPWARLVANVRFPDSAEGRFLAQSRPSVAT